MDENPSITPSPLAPHPHKEFFIIGSIFTLLMLLVATGIMYFGNNPLLSEQKLNSHATVILNSYGEATDYSKDDQYVYYKEQVISEADLATFKIAVQPELYDASDKNNVYLEGERIEDVPDEHGGNGTWYTKSATHIFYQSRIIEEADPSTFNGIHFIFARDKNYFYVQGRPSPRTSKNDTFSYIEGVYYKDNSNISWYSVDGGGVIDEADLNTFVVLDIDGNGCYAKDSKQVFFCGDTVKGADPETFVSVFDPILKTDAQDKNHQYRYGRIVATTTVQ